MGTQFDLMTRGKECIVALLVVKETIDDSSTSGETTGDLRDMKYFFAETEDAVLLLI